MNLSKVTLDLKICLHDAGLKFSITKNNVTSSAKILICIDDNIFIKIMPEILIWLKDLNWPGAKIIFEKIEEFPSDMIEEYILNTIEKAKKEKDYSWIEFLLWLENAKTKKL